MARESDHARATWTVSPDSEEDSESGGVVRVVVVAAPGRPGPAIRVLPAVLGAEPVSAPTCGLVVEGPGPVSTPTCGRAG
jgi:hypothetical protein